MDVSEWRARLRSAPELASRELLESLHRGAARLEKSGVISRSDVDDIAQTAWVRLATTGYATAQFADPDTALDSWTLGVVRHIASAAHRARLQTVCLEHVSEREHRNEDESELDSGASRGRLDGLVATCGATAGQLDAYRLIVHESLTVYEASRRLGVDRKSVWERLQRLVRRARKKSLEEAATPDRDWIALAVRCATARGDLRGARVFQLHAAGVTHASIAREVGLSPQYVAVKIARARARAVGSLPAR